MKSIELRIIKKLQQGYPLCEKPYKQIAKEVDISEKTLLKIIQKMKKNKTIRRTGVTLSHYRLGIKNNAMVVWNVDSNKVEKIGKIMGGFEFVSHCYERPTMPDWKYNLYTMVHAKTKKELEENINRISMIRKIKDYKILNSIYEFKKSSPRY